MVRRPERVLVQAGPNVREEQFELPQELLVARSTRTDRRGNSDLQARLYEAFCLITNVTIFPLQISAKTWRRGLGECRMCSLGPSDRLVQQYCLERRTPLLPAVRPRHGAIRVEQNTEVPVHSRNGKFNLVASGKGTSIIDVILKFFFPGFSLLESRTQYLLHGSTTSRGGPRNSSSVITDLDTNAGICKGKGSQD